MATEYAALKDMFDAPRLRHLSALAADAYPDFDARRFLKLALHELESLSLLQRLRRVTESLHATLPADFRRALPILKTMAPQINHGFVSLVLPDYVALYGQAHVRLALDALRYFTTFGSSEFAVRHFLRNDLARTLAVMQTWAEDDNEHVRRLASEGTRPRLPWSFKLDALVADPRPALPILETLRADPSLYVRKSVGNHLNDIGKDHPALLVALLQDWPRDHPATQWIARRGLRSLVKAGDRAALGLIGAGTAAAVSVGAFKASPVRLTLGETLNLRCTLSSQVAATQHLVVDYAVHYVKQSGVTSAKVFKWKEFDLPAGQEMVLSQRQVVRDFTTRVHHPGRHVVELLINGAVCGRCHFDLAR